MDADALQAAAAADLGGRTACAAAAGSLCLGAALTAVGAPFGALAPGHFSAFVSAGVVSNLLPDNSSSECTGSQHKASKQPVWETKRRALHPASRDLPACATLTPALFLTP